jgi:hypothetical protein
MSLLVFFFEQLEAPSLVSSSRFALPREQLKIALTASSPKAWLVAISRSSLVFLGCLRPSLWTKDT